MTRWAIAALGVLTSAALLASLVANWWLWGCWREADAELSSARASLAAYETARSAADTALLKLDTARLAAREKEKNNAQLLRNLEQDAPGLGDGAYFERLARMLEEYAAPVVGPPSGGVAPELSAAPGQ